MEMAMIPHSPEAPVLLGHPVVLRSSKKNCTQLSVPKRQEDPTSPELYLLAPKHIAKRLS